MIDKITEIAPFADKPKYVKNYLNNKKLPTQEELDLMAQKENKRIMNYNIDEEIKNISNEEAINIMTEGLSNLGYSIVDIDNAKKLLLQEIQNSYERKKELLEPILRNNKELNLTSNKVLFQIYSAANPLVNQDLTLNTISAKYGGCRMFLCDLFDYNEDFDFVEDWFTGSCLQCLKRIKKKHYAVRLPRPHGGWENCYCSFKCMRENLYENEAQEAQPDLLSHELITAFEKRVNEIGIQDRE
jgi:hypothetical protein